MAQYKIIIDKEDTDKALNILQKAGAQPEQIGKVTATEGIIIHHQNKRIILD